jgi:serine/threonine-protein kinase HipA
MSPDQVAVVLDDARFASAVEVGLLSRQGSGSSEIVRFAYAMSWLENTPRAFAIDPELPLYPGDFFPSAANRMFGVFRDTSPDRWGRVLMERREALDARAEARKPRRLGEWGFLLGVSDATRIGALRLRTLAGPERFLDDHALGAPPAARLRELEAIALALDDPKTEERPEYAAWLRQLLAPGTSLGGARPKATFAAKDDTLWIAKFPGREDRYDVGAWAFLAHELAERARIQLPHAELLRLGSRHHTFAVQRFDRERKRRRLYASAMTLLVRSDGDDASYLDIVQALQDQGDPATLRADLEQLYRRVLFNVLVGNRDDHLRNHGFLRGDAGWRLAPAFDLNPNPDKDEHALALDDTSRAPSVATVRATRELYRLTRVAAGEIEQQVRAALSDWRARAEAIGISRREIEQLTVVIDPALL